MNNTDRSAAIRPPVHESRYLGSAAIPWEATDDEGFWIKRLYEDPDKGEKTWLMKVDPGAFSPSHAHAEFEQFYVLEGTIRDDHGDMQAGDFVCRPPGDRHWAASDGGALVLLVYTRR